MFMCLLCRIAKTKREDVRPMKDRTLIFVAGSSWDERLGELGLSYIHPSVVHLADSHEISPPRLAIPASTLYAKETLASSDAINCYSPIFGANEYELGALYVDLEKAFYN